MKQILSAINHCHSIGVMHRDIKPENIMINDQNLVRIIDFGLSRHFGQ
jgi:serine/threonine protein kinase